MHETFIEDAENQVDGDDGGQYQPRLIGDRFLEGAGRALEAVLQAHRRAEAGNRPRDGSGGL